MGYCQFSSPGRDTAELYRDRQGATRRSSAMIRRSSELDTRSSARGMALVSRYKFCVAIGGAATWRFYTAEARATRRCDTIQRARDTSATLPSLRAGRAATRAATRSPGAAILHQPARSVRATCMQPGPLVCALFRVTVHGHCS